MLTDRYDNALSTTSEAARDAYVAGVDHILAATYGARDSFEAAIAADPGFALAHAGLARAAMFDADMPAALASIRTARALVDGQDGRTASHVAILDLLLKGKTTEVRRRVPEHLAEHPRDVLIAQLCTNIFGLIGMSGEPGRESMQVAYTSGMAPHFGEDWWFLSVHGQALCEVGRLDEAMHAMERSLAANGDNANASHFKAHTLYERGDTDTGRAYLADWIGGYDRRALLHGHLSWHRALWALEQGDEAEVWSVYDKAVAPDASASLPINVLTDAASLLHRTSLAGISVDPSRWRHLSAYAARQFPHPGVSFVDMHAALAHAMAGDGEALARFAEADKGVATDLVRPVARAWQSMVRQDWACALADLTPVMANHARLGGSRAQRDLLELTFLNLLLKLGLTEEARRSMATRRPVFASHAPVAGYA